MPAETEATLPLPSLSLVPGKQTIACFGPEALSSDGGPLLALREVEERRSAVAAPCRLHRRSTRPGAVQHIVADMLHFHVLMSAAGYDDRNDAHR